jgi:hypothetical protein
MVGRTRADPPFWVVLELKLCAAAAAQITALCAGRRQAASR